MKKWWNIKTDRKIFNEVNIDIVSGNIIEIIQGEYDTLILTDSGNVYGCGNNAGSISGAGSLGINNGVYQTVIKKIMTIMMNWQKKFKFLQKLFL